jgi:hypothetical protein
MRVLVLVKRVVDYNMKVPVRSQHYGSVAKLEEARPGALDCIMLD